MGTLIDRLVDDDSEPYWSGLAAGRLLLKRCADCGYLRPPPVYRTRQPSAWVCPDCLSEEGGWEQVSGDGEVETFVWYLEDVLPADPDLDPFRLPIPYSVALVRLAEGPRVLTNVVDVARGDLAVGDPVTAVFVPVEDRAILRFRPAGARPRPDQRG